MRSLLFGLVALVGALNAATPLLTYDIEDKEEAFLVRRIAEFWKDQDYKIVKKEIAQFLEQYPKSKLSDHLRGILGDLYLQEKKYEEALVAYEQIHAQDILEKVAINKLQCYYELGQFEKMIEAGKPFVGKTNEEISVRLDEFHFLMGEAYFRYADPLSDQGKKLDMMKRAEPLYEKVLGSAFNDSAMFALAEIYRMRKDNQKAAQFFTELSLRHSEQKEDLLFHAGLAQAEFDKKQAIETFTQVAEKGGVKAKDANLNRIILFFQEERFKDVIEAYPKIINEVDFERQNALDYIIGRSYFAIEDYAKASDWLEKYARLAKENSPELRNTLLMQLNCAQNLHSEEKYQLAIQALTEHFPKDSELPQASFIHAIMLKETGKLSDAEKKLEELITKHPNFEDQESLFLEYSLITYKNENWGKCHATLSSFLKQYPKSAHAPIAWKYFLSSSLNLLKTSETSQAAGYSKKHFLQDLNKVLEVQDILTLNEQKECRFLQGKIAYELGLYKEALDSLKSYLASYQDDPTAAEAHLIVALCHQNLKKEPELFCQHAEVALKSNPELKNKSSIHLELFNVYLSLIEGMEKSSKKDDLNLYYDLAADHLFSAMTLKDLEIKVENKLWLANYYLTKIVKQPQLYETDGAKPRENDGLYLRSKALFEGVLIKDSACHLTLMDKDHTYLEWEVLKLANCLGREKQYSKKITLLTDLIEQQNKNASWKWKLQKEALLELAKTYELENKKESAYETFQFIAEHHLKEPSFAAEYAAIHAARLKFDLMSPVQKSEDNAEVQKILTNLKEFQIRKNPSSEPLHLEAALEYAWIRAQLASDTECFTKYRFFLNRIKEDFDNLEDQVVVNYHKGLKADNDKMALYNGHMQFINAELARCDSSADTEKQLLHILNTTPSSYLHMRTQKSLQALKKSKLT